MHIDDKHINEAHPEQLTDDELQASTGGRIIHVRNGYKCPLCPTEFLTQESLDRHIKEEH